MTRDASTEPRLILRPLEHVDEIRDLLHGPGRGRPRAARCELLSVRLRVDNRPAIAYYPDAPIDELPTPGEIVEDIRRARREHHAAQLLGQHAEGLARLAEASRRRARTEANLEWLRGWGPMSREAERETARTRRMVRDGAL